MLGLVLQQASHHILLIYWLVVLLHLSHFNGCVWVPVVGGVVLALPRGLVCSVVVSVGNYKQCVLVVHSNSR